MLYGILVHACRNAGAKVEQGYDVIGMKDYFVLLDGVFTASKNLQAVLQKKLKEYYPVLKVSYRSPDQLIYHLLTHVCHPSVPVIKWAIVIISPYNS